MFSGLKIDTFLVGFFFFCTYPTPVFVTELNFRPGNF